MQPVVRFLAILWFFIYMAFAIYGCMQLREGLEPINLLVEDSYAIPHYKVLEKYFWHYGATVQVIRLFKQNYIRIKDSLLLHGSIPEFEIFE